MSSPSARPESGPALWTVDLLAILGGCIALSAVHWLKLGDLVSGDSVRWFLEAHRAASGEVPYRDFSWLYPPLGLWVFAAPMRLFGSSFLTIQCTLDLLSTMLCLSTWLVAREILPRRVALAVAILTILAGGSNGGNFALFSLSLYAPGLLTGQIGILLFALPLIRRLRTAAPHRGSAFDWKSLGMVAVGGTAACLSKVEFALAVFGGCLIFEIADRFRDADDPQSKGFGSVPLLALVSFGPAVIILSVVGYFSGGRQLLAALGGYGLAKEVCPWWPTGVGILSVVAVIGRTAALATVLSIHRFRTLARRWGWRYHAFLLFSAGGLSLSVSQLRYAVAAFSASQGPGVSQTTLMVRYLASLNGVFLSIMWVGLLFAAGAILKMARTRRLSSDVAPWVLVVGIGAAISSRSLFGDLFGAIPTVAQSAYPVWFIFSGGVALSFLHWFLGRENRARSNGLVVALALVGYGLLRLANFAATERGHGYKTLRTEAGSIRLRAYDQSATLYAEVLRLTTPESRILEVPFGGGLTFASHRRSSNFLTQFAGLIPSPFVESIDFQSYKRAPPALVVAADAPRYGSAKGLSVGCGFPRFAFGPPSHDPLGMSSHPSLVAIQADYQVLSRTGDRVILSPSSPTSQPEPSDRRP